MKKCGNVEKPVPAGNREPVSWRGKGLLGKQLEFPEGRSSFYHTEFLCCLKGGVASTTQNPCVFLRVASTVQNPQVFLEGGVASTIQDPVVFLRGE